MEFNKIIIAFFVVLLFASFSYAFIGDITEYGADPTGTNDSTEAVVDCFDATPNCYAPSGTYKLNNQTIYLDSPEANLTYHLIGEGYSTILKPTNFSSGYLFKLNQNSQGNKILSYPAHPRLIIENLMVDGTDSTNASFLWYNEASFIFKNLKFKNILYGAYGTNYTDNITLENIKWDSGRSGGWIYRQGGNGDSFYAKQIFTTSNNAIWLYKNAGAVLESCNGGFYKFQQSLDIIVKGGHYEFTNNGISFLIQGSKVKFKDNFFLNNISNPVIYIDDDTGVSYKQKSFVTLEENTFATFIDSATKQRGIDVWLQNYYNYSRLVFKNNTGLVYTTGAWRFEPIGLKVEANDSTLNSVLQNNKIMFLGESEIKQINGTWKVTGLPPSDGLKVTRVVNQPSITYISSGTIYPGNILNNTTYYYKVAVYTLSGNTQGSSEANRTTTTDNQSITIVMNTRYAPVIVRIWRGSQSGTYDRYIDIPCSVLNIELYDQGDYIAGYPWITSNVPPVPTTNTTYDGYIFE